MKLPLKQPQAAKQLFREIYSAAHQWTSIAPGRVNLIGEHTDYNLLPVLPMTIDRTINIHGRTRTDGLIRISNVSDGYPNEEFDLNQPITPKPGHWTNYIRAAADMVIRIANPDNLKLKGFDALIEADLPPAAGLSSSSALVIASCLAILNANNISWTMEEVAERMRLAEQFVGTAGGGMDQAIISLGKSDSALLIEFDPLITKPVLIPDDLNIYIIDSGIKAEKTGTSRYAYNVRALSCDIAVELLKSQSFKNIDTAHWNSLRDVYKFCNDSVVSWQEMLLAGIPPDSISISKITESITRDKFDELCHRRQLPADTISEWLPTKSLPIYARAAHVLGEADRVYAFEQALLSNNLEVAGQIANASHASCRDLYHISTPEMESLVAKSRKTGALATRITGAGFGGCLVAFVNQTASAEYIAGMTEQLISETEVIECHPHGSAHVETLN